MYFQSHKRQYQRVGAWTNAGITQKGTEAWLRHSLTPTLTFSWFLHLENVNGGDSKGAQLCELIYVTI